MIVQVITVRLVKTQNHGNLRSADGAPTVGGEIWCSFLSTHAFLFGNGQTYATRGVPYYRVSRIFISCIFHPCNMVPHFHVPQFHVSHFQRPQQALSAPPLWIDISRPHGDQQETCRTLRLRSNDGTDRRTDARPFHRPCSAYYASSVINGLPHTFTKQNIWFLPCDAMLCCRRVPFFCISQAGIVSRQLDESSWFSAWRLPFTYPTLCYNEIWVSPKIVVLPSGTLSETPDLGNFATASWSHYQPVSAVANEPVRQSRAIDSLTITVIN